MIKKMYGKIRPLTQEVCSCGGTVFELWYWTDVLYSKCVTCDKESLQTCNKDYGPLEEDL